MPLLQAPTCKKVIVVSVNARKCHLLLLLIALKEMLSEKDLKVTLIYKFLAGDSCFQIKRGSTMTDVDALALP